MSLRTTLRDAPSVARVVADHAELWIPGAVAWLVTVGWVVFLLAVVVLPGEGDLAFFATGVWSSSAWPLNAWLMAVTGVMALLVGLALLGLAEVALWRWVAHVTGAPPHARAVTAVWRLIALEALSAVPVLVALLVLVGVAVTAVPDAFQTPDGGDLVARIVRPLAPGLALVGVALFMAQALAAAAGRRALRGAPLGEAMLGALADLRRAPAELATLAIGSALISSGYAIGSWLLLRVLWAPIGAGLAAGSGIGAGAGLLLVGFVAIWLCLVLGGGAVHAWASTWWTLELRIAAARPARPPTVVRTSEAGWPT